MNPWDTDRGTQSRFSKAGDQVYTASTARRHGGPNIGPRHWGNRSTYHVIVELHKFCGNLVPWVTLRSRLVTVSRKFADTPNAYLYEIRTQFLHQHGHLLGVESIGI